MHLEEIEISADELNLMSEIFIELAYAEKKFPRWPESVVEQAAIVCEESGELIRAALQLKYEGGNVDDCRKEAIQTAAMAIRFLKNLK